MQWQVRSLFLTSASDEFVWGDRNYSLTCRYLYGHLSRLSIFSRYSWYRLKPQSIRAWFSSTVVLDDHMSPTLTCYHWPSPWPYLFPLPQLWPEVKEHSLYSKFYFRNLEMSLYKRRSQFVVWRHLIQRRWWTDNILGIDFAAICQSEAFVADLNTKWVIEKSQKLTLDARIEAIPSIWYQSRAVIWGLWFHFSQSLQKPCFKHQWRRKSCLSYSPFQGI